MHSPKRFVIPDVQYPDGHVGSLKQIAPRLVTAVQRDGFPTETGTFDIGPVSKDERDSLFFITWIGTTNEVIANLNMAIHQLTSLPTLYSLTPFNPRHQFYFYVHAFFHEFYRVREIYSQTVKAASDIGWIQKSEVASIRHNFHEVFEKTISLRNNLVHNSVQWLGEKHSNLMLMSMLWERGGGMQSIKTGEITTIRDALADICPYTAEILFKEGSAVRDYINSLVPIYVKFGCIAK